MGGEPGSIALSGIREAGSDEDRMPTLAILEAASVADSPAWLVSASAAAISACTTSKGGGESAGGVGKPDWPRSAYADAGGTHRS